MYPDGNRLALALLPIPVREQMQHWFGSPPGLVVIEVVFGEAAHVDDSELRVDGRPSVRCGFAAIVEAGPGEPARQPLPRSIEFPPFFGELRPGGVVQIVRADPVA